MAAASFPVKQEELSDVGVRSGSAIDNSKRYKIVKQESVDDDWPESGHSAVESRANVMPVELHGNPLIGSRTSAFLQRLSRIKCSSSEETLYTCGSCDYKTHCKPNLLKHKWTHTGEKPLACNFCEYRCSHTGDLKKHIRKHTGEKPYACTMCDFRSVQVGNLRKHMNTHTGQWENPL